MNRRFHYLLTYIEQLNRASAIFTDDTDSKPITLEMCKDPAVYKKLYLDLDAELSPENLSCDGEVRGSSLYRKKFRLIGAWQDLNKLAGLELDYDSPELESWHEESLTPATVTH